MCVIKKTIITTIITFFFGMVLCYASEENIYVEKNIENNYFIINFVAGNDPVNGIQADIIYNLDNLSFFSCEGNSDYEVNVNNNKIVIESLIGHNNTVMATCKYKVLNKTLISMDINNIKSSDSKIINTYQDINLKEELTPTDISNSNENKQTDNYNIFKVMVCCILMLIFVIISIFLIFYFKKKLKVVLFMIVLLVPISILADDKVSSKRTIIDVDNIRDYLLGKKNLTEQELQIYDYDSDSKITINDLIKAKIDINLPNISYTGEEISKKGEYATKVVRNINVSSISDIVSLKYCITTKGSCVPNNNYQFNGNQVKMNIKFENNKQKQRICVEAVNKLGFKYNLCDSKTYLIDDTLPTISLKSNKIFIDSDTNYNAINNIKKYTFGVGGGNLKCTNTDSLKIGTNKIICTAKGNNGLEASSQFDIIRSTTYNKTAVFFGDSITKGYGSKSHNYSWANYIGDNYDLKYSLNRGKSGWRVSNTDNNYINNLVLKERGNKYDFVILHGGCNDIGNDVALGKISSSYDPKTFDDQTFIGGLEKYLYTVVTQWPKARIGYIINYSTPNNRIRPVAKSSIYYAEMRKVLKKWNVPYLDLFNGVAFDGRSYSTILSVDTNRYLPDTLHLNDEGYKVISPYIYGWMQTLNQWKDPR